MIAIIGLLAAILFPVFSRVREKARQAACASNLKQLGLAYQQYAQDNDERFPSSYWYGRGWAGKIYPYVKSAALFKCPNDKRVPSGSVSPISYAVNSKIANYDGTAYNPVLMRDGFPRGFPLNQMTQPAVTVLMYEGSKNQFNNNRSNLNLPEEEKTGGDTSWVGTGGKPVYAGCSPTDSGVILDVERHDGDQPINQYLFLDGHVKLYSMEKVADPCNSTSVPVGSLGASGFSVTFAYN